jgi:hypothetical protein
MVRARRRGIVAVVGGHHEQIAGAEPLHGTGQTGVDALEVGGIAGDVVAMAVLHVAVDEVGEDEARGQLGERARQRLDAVGVAHGGQRAGDAAAGKEIPHLADGDHRLSRGRQRVEQRVPAGSSA